MLSRSLRTLVFILLAVRGASSAELPLLTTTAEVRELSPEEAAFNYPVRLEAVVTFSRPKEYWCFIQDATGGTACVRGVPGLQLKLEPGQRVHVEGQTVPGGYAPNISVTRFTVLGQTEIPAAVPRYLNEIFSGPHVGTRVEVRGVVRSVHKDNDNQFAFQIASGGSRLQIVVLGEAPPDLEQWVDSMVRVRGVCGTKFNKQRQSYGVMLNVNHAQDVFFEERPPSDPFSIKQWPLEKIMQFNPKSAQDRRIKVSGKVVQCQVGHSFFIEDDTSGLQVLSHMNQPLEPGDQVEVLGFPAWGDYAPRLEDATLRLTGHGSAPVAATVSAEDLMACQYDSRLVCLEARLVEQTRKHDEHVIVLKAGELLFHARFGPGSDELETLPNDSLLSVTGVCCVHMGGHLAATRKDRAESFELALRSPADVVLLQAAPWWTMRRVAWLAGGLSVLFVGAMSWNTSLRQRVKSQTAIIAERLRSEAALEERARVARELHDTVEQDLAAVALHLGVIADQGLPLEPVVQENLDAAFKQVRRSLADAHQAVWDLRSTTLVELGLAVALEEALTLAVTGRPITPVFALEGTGRRLASVTEHHLLRLGGEAIMNAVHHARAQRLEVTLKYEENALTLRVQDDGCGFEVEAPCVDGSHHFGLLGMKERAARIGAGLRVNSSPGKGTLVEVQLSVVAS